MNKKVKKYYTLYKIERNEEGKVKDLRYIYEVATYNDITEHLNIAKRNVSKMINEHIPSNWDTLKHYADYTIIKEH